MSRRPRRTALFSALGAGVVATALVVVLASRPGSEPVGASSALVGRPAPAVAGRTVSGGRASLAAMRGRYVLVVFFASYCVPCQDEAPQLVAFAYEHARRADAAVLGVDLAGDSVAQARVLLATAGAHWPVVVDSTGGIETSYGVASPPVAFLVSPSGRVLDEISGALTSAYLDRLLAEVKSAT